MSNIPIHIYVYKYTNTTNIGVHNRSCTLNDIYHKDTILYYTSYYEK